MSALQPVPSDRSPAPAFSPGPGSEPAGQIVFQPDIAPRERMQGCARVTVEEAGTTLNSAALPAIERHTQTSCVPPPPSPFSDRDEEQLHLLPELRPQGGAWLHGPPGSGLTALLRHAGHRQEARRLPDGVVSLPGDGAPPFLDDIVQQLCECFYGSAVPVKFSRQAAASYLGRLKGLVLLDSLPLNRPDLERLADLLPESAVLIAGSGAPPDSLLGIAVDRLPRAAAMQLYAGVAPISDTATAAVERLCDALGDLPLPLLLAAHLARSEAVTAEHLVARLEAMTEELEPLARVARLALELLSDKERTTLAALVSAGGPEASTAALAEISGLAPAELERALTRLTELRLVEENAGRYGVAGASLRRVLRRLLDAALPRRAAAAYFARAAAAHGGDLEWLQSERSNLMAALQSALAEGQAAEAGALARALQPLLVLRGLWESWQQVIDGAEQAARASGDRALLAWALHERGTRAGLLGDLAAAAAGLQQAWELRRALGDRPGIAATEQNREYLGLRPAVARRSRSGWLVGAATTLVLFLILAAITFGGRKPSAPTPRRLAATTAEDSPLVIALPSLRSGKAAPSSITITSRPKNGRASADARSRTITYVPDPDFHGKDGFTYTRTEGSSRGAGEVTVTVTPVNDAPVPTDDTATGTQDRPLTLSLARLLANDLDPDLDELRIVGASPTTAQGGRVKLARATVTYTPAPGFSGLDRFTYTVTDGREKANGTVTVEVRPVAQARQNRSPIAGDDTFATEGGKPLRITGTQLRRNDRDPDGDRLTLVGIGPASSGRGKVTLAGDTVEYQPSPGFSGTDRFSYTVSDGRGGTATASVRVRVRPAPPTRIARRETWREERASAAARPAHRRPYANDDLAKIPQGGRARIDVLANDSDPDGRLDPGSLEIITPPRYGRASVNRANGVVTYEPPPDFAYPVHFTYQVRDRDGGRVTATVFVTIARTPSLRETGGGRRTDLPSRGRRART